MTQSQPPRAIVTGAGGEIGAAVARRLTKSGAKLALFDRRLDLLEPIVAECQAAGSDTIGLEADQTSREDVEAAVESVVASFGGVDVLFANAGYGKFASFLEQSEQSWLRHVEVNLNGTFRVCQVVARQMCKQRTGGVIVVNASSGATQYTNLLSAYCITKAGLAMMVQAMASELGSFDIRVNGVLPGVIETGMTLPALDSDSEQRSYLTRETPAGRLGRPEDVAGAVGYLISADASFVTGQCIAVDGGQTLLGQPQWYVTDFSQRGTAEWITAR